MSRLAHLVLLPLLATFRASAAAESECEGTCPATGGSSMIHMKQQVQRHQVTESVSSECDTCKGCLWPTGNCGLVASQWWCDKHSGKWCGQVCTLEKVCEDCAQCAWSGGDLLPERGGYLPGKGNSPDDCTFQCWKDKTCKFAALSTEGLCHLFNTCTGSEHTVEWTRWEKKCSLTSKCKAPAKDDKKYLGDMADPCNHPYVYADRASASDACSYVGLELCSKADIDGWSLCKAGWLSDGKGYYVNDVELKGPCGSGVGYQNWGGSTAGAYCCPESKGIKGLKSGDKVNLVNLDHNAYVGTCGSSGAGEAECSGSKAQHDIYGYKRPRQNLDRVIYEVKKTSGRGSIRHGDEVTFYQQAHNTYLGLCGANCKCNEGIHCAYGFPDSSHSRVKWIIEEADGFMYLKNPSHDTYLCMCGGKTGCDASNYAVLGCKGKPARARFEFEPVL